MSKLTFQSKMTVDSAIPTENYNEWEVVCTLSDGEGVFSGADVQNGDILVIDTSPYEGGTITFYEVRAIVKSHYRSPTLKILYMSDNDNELINPDISYSLGMDGIITRPFISTNLLSISSSDAQGMNNRFSTYLTNINMESLVEKALGDFTNDVDLPIDNKFYGKVNNEWKSNGDVVDSETGVVITDLGTF